MIVIITEDEYTVAESLYNKVAKAKKGEPITLSDAEAEFVTILTRNIVNSHKTTNTKGSNT